MTTSLTNNLIYGKDDTQRIVAIEPQDEIAEIFTEALNGSISSHFVDNRYWFLSSKRTAKASRLGGDLTFKYGRQFKTKSELYQTKRFLNDEDVFMIHDPAESLMVKNGYTFFKGMKHNEISVLSFDLETTTLSPHDEGAKILLISVTHRSATGHFSKTLFQYDIYKSQGEMLSTFCRYVNELNPSVIIGHNIMSFDLPYLIGIADQEGVQLELGRNGSPLVINNYESKFRKESGQFINFKGCHAYGRNFVDTMFLAIRYDTAARKYESYGLKNIIKQEGLEKKDRTFYDAQLIRENYKDPVEWEKIKAYCKDDADDALAVYDLTVPPFFYMNQSVPKTFEKLIQSASGSQLNAMMVRAYLQQGHSLPKAKEAVRFEGALSDGFPGIYSNVFKIDISSLYPSIMRQFKVCDKEKDPFEIMPQLVEYFTVERLKNKKLAKETGDKYYDHLQNSQKIAINSFYGFLGAPGLSFNSPENAAFITDTGRDLLQFTMDWSSDKGFTIANLDTDSISFCKKDQTEFTEEEQNTLLAEINEALPELIRFENDGVFKKVIILKAKNYALWDGNKLKIKGSALKAGTKEKALRELMDSLLMEMITGNGNYLDIYHKYIKEALDVKDINRWAFRKTISAAVINATRTNEQKVLDAIEEDEYQPGDRRHFFFRNDGSLCLVENFNGDYDKIKLISKIYNTVKVFGTVLNMDIFPKYHLKRSKVLLDNLIQM